MTITLLDVAFFFFVCSHRRHRRRRQFTSTECHMQNYFVIEGNNFPLFVDSGWYYFAKLIGQWYCLNGADHFLVWISTHFSLPQLCLFLSFDFGTITSYIVSVCVIIVVHVVVSNGFAMFSNPGRNDCRPRMTQPRKKNWIKYFELKFPIVHLDRNFWQLPRHCLPYTYSDVMANIFLWFGWVKCEHTVYEIHGNEYPNDKCIVGKFDIFYTLYIAYCIYWQCWSLFGAPVFRW